MAIGQTPILKNDILPANIITDIYTPNSGLTATIKSISFNNTANTSWTISLYKKILNPAKTILLYSKQLSAGDTLFDSDEPFQYFFGTNIKLQAVASVATITYDIDGYTESA